MISPTGKEIRSDSQGSGRYGSKRGLRMHKGTDFVCDPGQGVVSPISGHVIRVAQPYARSTNGNLDRDLPEYSGLLIQGETMAIKIFYIAPMRGIIGSRVRAGDVIGKAQDISRKYGPGMIPHVHVQVDSFDPAKLIDMTDTINGG